MTVLTTIFAVLLRVAGALAGFAAMFLVPEATLQEALATAGLAGTIDMTMAHMIAHGLGGLAGYMIASQVTGLIGRAPRHPPGTRSDAAAAVPRLRRHLVDGDGKPVASAVPRYLDPDPAPTKPVAVSFKELGLEHPQVSEYPDPASYNPQGFDEDRDETEDEVGELAESSEADAGERLSESLATEADPGDLPPPAAPTFDSPPVEPALTSEATCLDLPLDAIEEPEIAPLPDSLFGADASVNTPEPEPEPVRTSPALPAASALPPAVPPQPPAVPQPQVVEHAAVEPMPAYFAEDPARPSFAMPESGADPDWYDGAGDEEEDAEDDGAGYGSLSDIGLGRTHAPRAAQGQPGEADLPPPTFEAPGTSGAMPHGKPQDFRLREALAELMRVDSAPA